MASNGAHFSFGLAMLQGKFKSDLIRFPQPRPPSRPRYTTEQLAGLGEATHPLEFLAALDSLRTLAAMQVPIPGTN